MNSVLTLDDLSQQAPAAPTGDLIELRRVGIDQMFVDFHRDLPSSATIVGIVLFALNYSAFHAVAFPRLSSEEVNLMVTMTLGIDALLLSAGYICAREDNRRLAALAAKTGRPLLPPRPLHHRFRDWLRKTLGELEGTAPVPLPAPNTVQQRLRALCADPQGVPDRMADLLATIDRWQAISGEVASTPRAKTNLALENLVRCAETLHASPNLSEDDDLVGEWQDAAYALTSAMEQDIAKVAQNKTMALSAEIKAITKGMER